MLYATYRKSDGQFLRVWPNMPPYDAGTDEVPGTEEVQTYPEHLRPNLRTERFDDASPTKKRPATAQEITDYDEARKTLEVEADLDSSKIARLLFEVNFDQENRLRTL